MANRRMISRDVIETSAFYRMPHSAQALYIHCLINADDEGIIDNIDTIIMQLKSSVDDLNLLLGKGYLIYIDEIRALYVITDFHLMNAIQPAKYTGTRYPEALTRLIRNADRLVPIPPGMTTLPAGAQTAYEASLRKYKEKMPLLLEDFIK